ncbi:MAG: 1-acyl-sn-glycerol-3-phosphate acyltransferase [Planctomycetes bacterium]|nr:1-acyl-sn-glycerol-3-phosphate acyltransferase [Planctomycetota bacterium]
MPYGTPPQWWPPRLSPFWIQALRIVRLLRQRNREHLVGLRLGGLRHLRASLTAGQGIVIIAKHASTADPFILLGAGDRIGRPFSFMVAWQVFQLLGPVGRWVLQRHGCFSVDRDGTDMRAFRQAVEVVCRGVHPLVIFPEGDIFHNSDWVFPFRTGAAAVARAAARRGPRPVVCIPAALRIEYVGDPTPELRPLMTALEGKLLGQARPEWPLASRVQHFADRLLAHWEAMYGGGPRHGPLAERALLLADAILAPLEDRYGRSAEANDVPARVWALRQEAVARLERLPPGDAGGKSARHDLEQLFAAEQAFSYCRDDPRGEPSVERLAEMLDKFEEDVLGAAIATVRGKRRGLILFGEPITVAPGGRDKKEARALTDTLETALQRVVTRLADRTRGAARAHGFAARGKTPGEGDG